MEDTIGRYSSLFHATRSITITMASRLVLRVILNIMACQCSNRSVLGIIINNDI